MNAASIPAEVRAFFDLAQERGAVFVLVGGLAMLAHVQGRNTEDVDLLISLVDQERLTPEVKVIERESFFATARFGSLRIDYLAAEHPLFATVSRSFAEEREFEFLSARRKLQCATPEGLLLLKLYALPSLYRQGQIGRARIYESDIGSLLTAFPALEVEKLLDLLAAHGVSASDIAELRHIVGEQRPRPRRF